VKTDFVADNIKSPIQRLSFLNANILFFNSCYLEPPLIPLQADILTLIRTHKVLINSFLLNFQETLAMPSATKIPATHQHQLAGAVPPGTQNRVWSAFIAKVYSIFSKDSDREWDASLDEAAKKEVLKPIIAKFNQDFPEKLQASQILGYFISFITDTDCEFANGAQDYAWLFLEQTMPESTDMLRNLRLKLNSSQTCKI
jgi:hypothetical protein